MLSGRTVRRCVLVAIAAAGGAVTLQAVAVGAGEGAPDAVVLVLDASGSMLDADGKGGTKIEAAKAAMATVIAELPADQAVGLRVYGHRVPSSNKAEACQDTEAIVPVGPLDPTAMQAAVDSFAAKGETPIGLSLREAAADLPPGGSGAIVLVSDGEDECFPELGPEPCAVAEELAAGGLEIRIETVGLLVNDPAKAQLTCIADATGGTYSNVTDVDQLAAELSAANARARRSFEARGKPVTGGPSQIDATPLDDGEQTYTDTILNDEELWYVVEVPAGHRARVELTFDGNQNDSAFGAIRAEWFDEESEEQGNESEVNTGSDVVTFTSEAESNEDAAPRYLKVSAGSYRDEVEYPIVFTISSSLDPEATTTTTEADTSTTSEVVTDDAVAASPTDSGDPAVTIPGVLLGLVIGALGAGLAPLLIRRRRLQQSL